MSSNSHHSLGQKQQHVKEYFVTLFSTNLNDLMSCEMMPDREQDSSSARGNEMKGESRYTVEIEM